MDLRAESRLAATRRQFLSASCLGLGSLALNSLLSRSAWGRVGAASTLHHTPTAKRVLLIFALGGPSQLELFDDKPLLRERHGDDLPLSLLEKGEISTITRRQGALPVVGSAAKFADHGESRMRLSEYVPGLARHADRIALVRSMQTGSLVHERATVCFFTGTPLLDRPSMGAWVNYGLGSANSDLPEFVSMASGKGDASAVHARMWGSGFLPGHHQGVAFRDGNEPVLFTKNPPGVSEDARAGQFRALAELNELEAQRGGHPEVQTRIRSYEQAARMQLSVPELADLSKEPDELLRSYGAERKAPSFARNCLFARRLFERGVRFVQLLDRGWDHHGKLPESIEDKCRETDQPIAALLDDLSARGMLDDTLVIFAGEFGRTPYCEGGFSRRSYGRDHNNRVGGLWLAGGGVRGGAQLGETDEWGWSTVADPVHVNDIQATALHCLGFDHKRLVHRFQGRDFRLTDVGGRVLHELLA